MAKIGGYVRVEEPFGSLRLSSDYVALEEMLERAGPDGLVLPSLGNAKMGKVLKIEPDLTEMTGVRLGDVVVFQEWEGGRWAFQQDDNPAAEVRCLIMSSDFILARVAD